MAEKLINIETFRDFFKKEEAKQKLEEANIQHEIIEMNRSKLFVSYVEWMICVRKEDEDRAKKLIKQNKEET